MNFVDKQWAFVEVSFLQKMGVRYWSEIGEEDLVKAMLMCVRMLVEREVATKEFSGLCGKLLSLRVGSGMHFDDLLASCARLNVEIEGWLERGDDVAKQTILWTLLGMERFVEVVDGGEVELSIYDLVSEDVGLE